MVPSLKCYLLFQSLPFTGLRLATQVRLASQWASGICLSEPPQHCGYRCELLQPCSSCAIDQHWVWETLVFHSELHFNWGWQILMNSYHSWLPCVLSLMGTLKVTSTENSQEPLGPSLHGILKLVKLISDLSCYGEWFWSTQKLERTQGQLVNLVLPCITINKKRAKDVVQ